MERANPGSAVDAVSSMILSDGEGGATNLDWSADVTVVGAIASLAARLMGGVTQKLTAAFFDSTTSPVVPPIITSFNACGAAYDFASLMRPRMYGSSDR